MKEKTIQYLIISQSILIFSVFICLIISSQGLRNDNGISYYANYGLSLIPYILGLLFSALFMFLAARTLKKTSYKFNIIVVSLYLITTLCLGILVTPYYLSSFFDLLHTTIAITLFSYELIIAIWMVTNIIKDKLNRLLLIMLFITGLSALLSQIKILHYLLLSQLIYQIIFATILIRTCSKSMIGLKD